MLAFADLPSPAAELAGFEEVYNAYAGRMFSVALGVLHSHALAEEAVHEAFIKIIKNYQKFLRIDCQKRAGWIVIIIRNTSLDILRHEKRELPSGPEPCAAALTDCAGEDELLAVVAGLPPVYRDALSLRYVYGYDLGEIAALLGLSYAAAAQRLARARKLLKVALAEDKEEGRVKRHAEIKG